MKILVTGHLGFIGSHVYEYFTSQGHYVEGYDIPFDLGDFKTKKKFDLVIHLAAFSGIGEFKKNVLRSFNNNVLATRNLVNHAFAQRKTRLIFASSAAVYGSTVVSTT